ncbi:alpha/beta hydrolase [Pseudorhodoferax sp.]|uniref:alpha/beta hydrolase n=1 Tax=Pseudorhodoferax sp. TaxID=1993553 RepID=UPI002DD6A5B5|nr:alpha/beta fold hydrolase [Pseudorhodoferax sp.]
MSIYPIELPWATLSLVAILGAAYLLVSAFVAHRFTHIRRKLPQLQQEHPELNRQQVHFAARDGRARIEAWYLPAKPRQGAVILVHGKDACRGDELKSPTFTLAQRFRDAGISVLMIDLRGHGTSSRARLSYGWHERHDVLGAVDYLLERGYAPGRIGVLGASMGGATSVLAAAEEPAIGALVTDSAYASFEAMIERQYAKLAHLPHCFLPGALAIGRLLLGVDVRRVQPLAWMPQLRGRPVLVIHSHGDRFVPSSDAHALAEACGAECWRTDTDGHIGSYRALTQAYEERVVTFFARHLDVLPARHIVATEADTVSEPMLLAA